MPSQHPIPLFSSAPQKRKEPRSQIKTWKSSKTQSALNFWLYTLTLLSMQRIFSFSTPNSLLVRTWYLLGSPYNEWRRKWDFEFGCKSSISSHRLVLEPGWKINLYLVLFWGCVCSCTWNNFERNQNSRMGIFRCRPARTSHHPCLIFQLPSGLYNFTRRPSSNSDISRLRVQYVPIRA